MLLGWDALHANDWSLLSHAHGQASDTPGYLQRLSEDDDTAWTETIQHLHGAVTHQSSVYPATAPAALVVAGLLKDSRLSRPISVNGWTLQPVHAYLLSFLATVAEGTEPDSAVAARASHAAGFPDWGVLLGAAFPEPYSATDSLNDAQRAYLQALLDNDNIWCPAPPETFWTPDMMFAPVGLPYDHQSLSRIVSSRA